MSENNSGAEQGALPPARVAEHRAATVGAPVQLAQIVGGAQYVLANTQQSVTQPQTNLTQLTATSPSNLYTKIINISNLRTANITNPSIVNALTKPRATNVRTQLFPAAATQSSTSSTPDVGQTVVVKASPSTPRKRSRPDELPPGCENLTGTRAKVMEHKWARSWCIKESYNESVAEYYFLESGGTMMDYFIWRKRPRTTHYETYLRQHQLEQSSTEAAETPEVQRMTPVKEVVAQNVERLTQPGLSSILTATSRHQQQRVSLAPLRISHPTPNPTQPHSAPPIMVAGSSTMPAHNTSIATTTSQDVKKSNISSATTSFNTTASSSSASSAYSGNVSASASTSASVVNVSVSVTSSVPSPRPGTTPQSTGHALPKARNIAAAFPSTTNQEQIVEKAKQEAYVMQRVSELQREGLWTERRLPKVQEVQRCKSHWDYLLEEMVWLAADFAQERKWKKAAAKKCARMVQKYFQDKATAAQKAEKAQELQLKRIASFIAKEIKTFWSSVEKLVEFKQQTRLEEKRKQALDQHLSFIVDQTEKYSQLLAEGMNKSSVDNQTANSSRVPSPSGPSDDEFKPELSDTDDEETIAQAEAADEPDKQTEEIAALQRESQMELEDFLNELPKDYLANRDKILLSDTSDRDSDQYHGPQSDSDSDAKGKNDEDFTINSEGETDDENTIMEQEKAEGNIDHKQELHDLQAENEMSIEELRKKYLNLPPVVDSDDEDSDTSEDEDDPSTDEHSDDAENSEANANEDEDKVGLKMLLEDEEQNSSNSSDKKEDDDHLINDVAALAESIQPKGNTLNTTSVVTPIPFLLKHSLREYQHIGLDWLVTMYERKLNGILADEMGLGKTIQTIALLAHLACEKEDWGPHLIIVPTSVMLNWEMECKKWCPGFKILTYYGTQKERKLKRIGWTKPNAFHICITSYKLVIQDHQSFRRKKWKYLILDEAQNIKNFKSQRWQLLLNFQTQQRLLLTGTPLQNNLMELWSLMHFLMPHVFQSHREFKEWFSNPVTGMIEGNSEYNESIIKRLHKVLRPFLLRRLKSEVEKQMPKKFEHIIMCRLSKRQRFLYDDYMSRAKTRETLATGNLLSVINVLMQLRKVCNHPNLFEVRPTVSPFQCESLHYHIPSIVYSALDYDFFKHVNFDTLYLKIINMEFNLSAYSAYRTCKYRAPKKLIEMIDDLPEAAPTCPKGVVHMRVKLGEPKNAPRSSVAPTPVKAVAPAATTKNIAIVQQGVKLRVANPNDAGLHGFSVHIVSHHPGGGIKAIPVAALSSAQTQTTSTPTLNIAQLVQSQLGKHILLTQNANLPQASVSGTTTVLTSSGQRLTVLSKPVTNVTATTKPLTINSSAVTNQSNPIIPPKQVDVDSLLESSQAANEALASGLSLTRPLTSSLVSTFRTPNTLPSSVNNIQTTPPDPTKESDKFRSNWTEKSTNSRQSKLAMLHRLNEWRCHASPMYGQDLRECVAMSTRSKRNDDTWQGAYIIFEQVAKREKLWEHGGVLCQFVKRPDVLVQEMKDTFQRFVFCVPAVSAKAPSYRVLNPPQSKYWGEKRNEYFLMRELSPKTALLHPIASAMCTQFPDPRLIQYDCGKLQTLDHLLRRLKYGGHRVLIFTQMTRMLDVLEAFLNFHGHIYLRLDGTTKVDQRQVLMERFNGNPKIFAFILSTRSGGVGVNLTGADTVIFYDSDWNPTMDAQAQDRCHRIGQTRDVHIYRLVSEKTIEENILKKANQKRMLGDLAIEGGNFTTAYFKSSTIQDLFNVDTNEDDANARMSEVLNKQRPIKEPEPVASTSAPGEDRAALGALENALAACEDDQDVQAARTAKAEAVADLAEFDENIPLEETEKEPEMSKAELEVQNLIKQLTPIERYAMRFVEETEGQWSAEQLAAAERQIEEQKREWEENRLAALRQEEERRTKQQEEDNEMLTFSREDATNQIWLSDNTKEQMPMWCPPTPPTQDTDMYIDYSMGFLYEMSVMSESQLPPVYVRKEAKRTRHEANLNLDSRRALKLSRKDELVYEPRSLFDRPSPEIAKMRRELKQQRYRGIIRPSMPKFCLKMPTVSKPQPDPPLWHNWTIHEDMALLKVIQTFQGLPLNLIILSPGHTPNWDFAADYVNNTSITFRSPKQCRHRYETVIVSREEGKLLHDTSSRKKKTKSIYQKHPQQFKSNRPMRTAQLYTQDNNSAFSQLMIQRFDALKQISSKRPVTTKSATGNALMKNSKHTAVLTEYGIDYEHPLTPVDVAARRAERIAREKQKLGSMTAEQQRQAKQPSLAQSAVSQPTSIVPAAPATQTPSPGPIATVTNVQTTVQQQQQQQATLIVSAAAASGGAASGVTVATVQAPIGVSPTATTTLRTQRIVSSPLQQGGTVTNVTGLSPAHLAQRLIVTGQPVVSKTSGASGTVTVATSKAYTPAQLSYYRQQVALKQQQLKLQGIQAQTVKGVTLAGQPATVQVAVTQGQQRAQYSLQFVKQQALTVATGAQQTKTIARPVSETEMAAIIKQRQQQLQQQKLVQAGNSAQTTQQTTQQTLTQAQILAQVQQAGTSGTQVATLVKAVSSTPSSVTIPVSGVTLAPQVKAAIAAATQQQGTVTTPVKTATTLQPNHIRQFQIHQHLLAQKKFPGQKITQLAQVSGKSGVATQLIVQAPKNIQQLQQLQHVMRGAGSQLAVSQSGQVVLTAKAAPGVGIVTGGGTIGGQQTTAARVIPVNAAGQPQGLKQTIQVVTATSTGQATLVRPQVTGTGTLTGTIKVAPSGANATQQAILSQAFQGQPVTVRQSGSPVRIQTASGTPLVAVTVQQQQQQQQQHDQVGGHSRIQKKQ